MSWADDTRCLYCDGKLPLFRKLAQGQFCSKQHQEAYWKEQEALAVEVLHRTHDALQAYKPTGSIEDILGPSPVASSPAPSLFPTAPLPPPSNSPLPPLGSPTLSQPQRLPDLRQEPEPEVFVPSWAARTPEAEPVLESAPAYQPRPAYEPEPSSVAHVAYEAEPNNLAPIAVTQLPNPCAPPPIAGIPVAQGLALLDFQASIYSPQLSHREAADVALAEMVRQYLERPAEPALGLHEAEPVKTFTEPPLGNSLKTLGLPAPTAQVPQPERRRPASYPSQEVVASSPARFPRLNWSSDSSVHSFALDAAVGLFQLAVTNQPRDSHSPIVADVEHVSARHHELAFSHLSAGSIAHESALGGLVPLPYHAPVDAREARRPVSYQAFAIQGEVRRAEIRQVEPLEFAPNLTETVFKLNVVEKIKMTDCALPPRGPMPPFPATGETLRPRCRFEPATPQVKVEFTKVIEEVRELAADSPRRMVATVANFWSHAPRDLKMLLFAVPVALALAFHPSLPKVSTKAPSAETTTKGFTDVIDTQWANVKHKIAERAAVGLDENFRQGLDNWVANSGSTAEWAFDQAGFVMPGRVALYQPSLGLKDYEFQFLGAVDKGALSWVVRAADFQNYYVVKLTIVKPGPVPQMAITRYAVINGRAVDREDTPLVLQSRGDSLYRISMDIKGDHYALTVQGQMADSWDEPRLKHGGVGFFTNRGEQSRIGWVQITHQYDMLGRLFAYLAL